MKKVERSTFGKLSIAAAVAFVLSGGIDETRAQEMTPPTAGETGSQTETGLRSEEFRKKLLELMKKKKESIKEEKLKDLMIKDDKGNKVPVLEYYGFPAALGDITFREFINGRIAFYITPVDICKTYRFPSGRIEENSPDDTFICQKKMEEKAQKLFGRPFSTLNKKEQIIVYNGVPYLALRKMKYYYKPSSFNTPQTVGTIPLPEQE